MKQRHKYMSTYAFPLDEGIHKMDAKTYGRPKEMMVNAALKISLADSALSEDRLAQLDRLTRDLTPADLYWIAAYSAALASRRSATVGSTASVESPLKAVHSAERLSVVYGSQTGNARRVAEQLAGRAEAAGLSVRLLRAGAYPLRELAQERHLVVVISSQGDGDPPDDAIGFMEFISGKRAPRLGQLKFAVLGLGDSSYPKYCAVSRALDARLTELGASRFAELGEADVDFADIAETWSDGVLETARTALAAVPQTRSASPLHVVGAPDLYSREKPFSAVVLDNQSIVARDSGRDVRHIELSLEGSGLRYEPGDAIGVWPRNPSLLVRQWLDTLKLDGAREVEHAGRRLPLAQWLRDERELTRLTRPLLVAQARASGSTALLKLLDPAGQPSLTALLQSHQPIDVLRQFPAGWDADELVATLRPLTPRLYSIASSPRVVGDDEVHLTVGVVRYTAHGCEHVGAASAFLADACDDARVPVFVEANERFRLPADGSRDIIMIGPGTGVAPFRAFVQERQATAASGRNWLFFGNRHFQQDFLYQLEWQQALRNRGLQRLDLAFSRDHVQKAYVQHRMREQGRELYAWLRDGAHVYVCGDSAHMARDVHEALLEVIVTHGRQSTDDAKAWLGELLQQGRYARDVY
jgi:sulfite reductase (NADPH) flavoprotein alpha-component